MNASCWILLVINHLRIQDCACVPYVQIVAYIHEISFVNFESPIEIICCTRAGIVDFKRISPENSLSFIKEKKLVLV